MAIDESIQRYNRGQCVGAFDIVDKCHTELDVPLTAWHFFAMSLMRISASTRTRSLSVQILWLA